MSKGKRLAGGVLLLALIVLTFYLLLRNQPVSQLLDVLGDGFEACGVWLPIDDTIEVDTSQGVLVAQFGISWVETAAETGEYMETLNYNGEELTT